TPFAFTSLVRSNVTFNVTDLCQSGSDSASFTVVPAEALVISDVQNADYDSCDFADQAALDAAFAAWIGGFSVSGGCAPDSTDLSGLDAPDLCEGGSVNVTFNVTDLCQSGSDSATFTVVPAEAL